jgi:hypothetical protein
MMALMSDGRSDEGHVRSVPLLAGERLFVVCSECRARAIEGVIASDWQMAVVEQLMLRAALFTDNRCI